MLQKKPEIYQAEFSCNKGRGVSQSGGNLLESTNSF